MKVEMRHGTYGCGLYEVGTNGLRCFITDDGKVMAVEGRALTHEDLMTAFVWGRQYEQSLSAPPPQEHDDDAIDADDEELTEEK